MTQLEPFTRDVNSDTRVLLDVKLESVCLLECGFAEDEFSDVAAAAVSFVLSCVASDDTWLCIVDVTPFAPTANDVQSCLQALITMSA